MQTAYLLIGGNLGNRLSYLKQACFFIEQYAGTITAQSSIYETAAWGLEDQPSFLNRVLVLQTTLAPDILMKELLAIEEKMGRTRSVKFGSRIIDIDILLINGLIIDTLLLRLPHPALPERKFALAPLNEVAPDLIHPIEKKTINQLLLECTDPLNVQKYSDNAG